MGYGMRVAGRSEEGLRAGGRTGRPEYELSPHTLVYPHPPPSFSLPNQFCVLLVPPSLPPLSDT